jgi:hypothetical protein
MALIAVGKSIFVGFSFRRNIKKEEHKKGGT